MPRPYKPLTIICEFCHSPFIVSYGQRKRRFCSRSCQSKAIVRSDSRSISKCLVCDKEFKHYGNRIVCGTECNAIYLSRTRIAENNPYWKDDKFKTRQCENCNKDFKESKCGLHQGQIRKFCSVKCRNEARIGIKPNGEMAEGSNDYPPQFNNNLKNKIRKRDNYKCCLCSEDGINHAVHHIDSNKENCDESNLLSLCRRCHGLTYTNNYFWETIFTSFMSGSKIVSKAWGAEVHIVNNAAYCLKYLIFFKDCYFSNHWHEIKRELWYCIVGDFEMLLTDKNGKETISRFKKGDKVEIVPGIVHQLFAKQNSVLVEVSTQHFDEDSNYKPTAL